MAQAQVAFRTLEMKCAATFAKLEQVARVEHSLWKSGEDERWIDRDGVYHYGYPANHNWDEGQYTVYADLCTELGFRPTVGQPTKTELTYGE